MKPGNLVRITRATIGIPKGTVGLITKVESSFSMEVRMEKLVYYSVLINIKDKPVERRYLREDLRLI